MKWFNNWVLKQVNNATANAANIAQSGSRAMMGSQPINTYYDNKAIMKDLNSLQSSEKAIRFSVYNANGGRVVETRKLDARSEREITGLYVITSDQDFGNEIDKIITLESLKNG